MLLFACTHLLHNPMLKGNRRRRKSRLRYVNLT
jgi:hypothetical protein